ncbi:MAG: FKBP-type peptidyl-prolyl cis-trans isomerase [Phycisphaerales bacterium]
MKKIITAASIVCLAALTASVTAQEGKTAPASAPPANAAQPEAVQPATPAAPQGIPVPDGPVVNRQELEGGLIIEDLKVGTGYEVLAGGAVVAHYHGTLKADGKVFDSSFQRGEPVAFPLSGVIAGWQKGVPGMKIGGVRRLTVPAALGYGERGAGASIPPNSDLVFTIELVDAIQTEDTKVGEGEAISGQCVAVTYFTITDENGKELEKCDATKPPHIWFPNEYQPLSFGLDGMKPGGKRKITAPKAMNKANPNPMSGAHPTDQKVIIEVELVAARNLQPRR